MKLKVAGKTLRRWASDEYASWEDDACPDSGHVYNVLSRHSTVLEIRDDAELALVLRSGAYFGDASAFDCDTRHHMAVGRMVQTIKSAAIQGDK